MKSFKDMSVRKKLFLSMLTFSILIVVFITGIAVKNTYDTMREQLIYNRRMSIGWLQDRLELKLGEYQDRFYEFEVDRTLKDSIETWCINGTEPDYAAKWKLITEMNEVISMDSNINSMALFNLKYEKVLIAERTGASIKDTRERLTEWNNRAADLQSNQVFLRSNKEILAAHRMHRFSDKQPFALVVMYLRPYEIQEILDDIKMTPDETLIILNDEYELIETNSGIIEKEMQETAKSIARQMAQSKGQECLWDGDFWFYREVEGGKLKVLLSVPNAAIVESLKGTYFAALIAGVAMLAVCAVWSVLFSRIFAGPIIALSKTMRNFTIDDYEEQYKEHKSERKKFSLSLICTRALHADGHKNGITNNRKDEIGILQESFESMVKRNQKLIDQEYKLVLEKRNAQINALQAQINPHFMYNVMQVIGGMALNREAPEIYRVTTALGDLMRYCLNFSREMVSLKEEIHYMKSYCMLQNERFSGRINLTLDLNEELWNVRIPKLVLQPVLENSFQHGLAEKSGSWDIIVRGEMTNETDLLLTVKDNGIGIAEKRLEEIRKSLTETEGAALHSEEHIGLKNVNARIRLLYGEECYGIEIDSTEGIGTTVTIRLKM